GHDAAVAGAHGGADLLPVIAIALADGFGGRGDQFLVLFAQHGGECIPSSLGGRPTAVYCDNSFRPSRISCAASAFSPAPHGVADVAGTTLGGNDAFIPGPDGLSTGGTATAPCCRPASTISCCRHAGRRISTSLPRPADPRF